MRVIYNTTDITKEVVDYYSGTKSLTLLSTDALYIGDRVPFNFLYLKLSGTAQSAISTLEASYWDGSNWKDAVEVYDETSVSGKTLAQSGFVTITPDKNYGWQRESTNDGGETVTGLTAFNIYDHYWMKFTVDANCSAITVDWIGRKFSDDNDLGTEFPDLVRTSVKTAILSGKTNYEEQAIRAYDIIVNDLIANNYIHDGNQVLERDRVKLTSVSKVAEIIYGMLGDDYTDQRLAANKEYVKRLHNCLPKIDKNNNALIDVQENKTSSGSLYR